MGSGRWVLSLPLKGIFLGSGSMGSSAKGVWCSYSGEEKLVLLAKDAQGFLRGSFLKASESTQMKSFQLSGCSFFTTNAPVHQRAGIAVNSMHFIILQPQAPDLGTDFQQYQSCSCKSYDSLWGHCGVICLLWLFLSWEFQSLSSPFVLCKLSLSTAARSCQSCALPLSSSLPLQWSRAAVICCPKASPRQGLHLKEPQVVRIRELWCFSFMPTTNSPLSMGFEAISVLKVKDVR